MIKFGEHQILKFPEQVSAILLRHIKNAAEKFQGKKLSEVVITVPAAFEDSQNRATILAGKLAGFETIHLLPEPVAAAFAYFIDREIPENSTLLLFDLGGGTLDVCIFKIQNSQLKIISRSGNPNLGGRDFDNLLFDYLKEKLFKEYKIEIKEDKKCRMMFKAIKENLSTSKSDLFEIESIDASQESNITVTREEFEELSKEMLEKIEESILKAMEKVKLGYHQIDKVLQVGGGSRMPMIKELLKKTFPGADRICEQNPDEVVAVGAAYYSYFLNLRATEKLGKRIGLLERGKSFIKTILL